MSRIPTVGTIGEYTTSGATVNASLVSGLSRSRWPLPCLDRTCLSRIHQRHDWRIHHVGSSRERLAGLGVESSGGIAVSGSDLFVANYVSNGTIGEYTTSGATVNASLVSGLSDPGGIAVSGSNLFVANYGNDTIGEYTTSGGTVNASLVSGLSDPVGLAVSGSNLFVANG